MMFESLNTNEMKGFIEQNKVHGAGGEKTEKTMEFFNETCGVFLNYYDA